MKKADDWRIALADTGIPSHIRLVQAKSGDASLQVGEVFLHSQYNPRDEARRLVDSSGLDPARPVLAVGLGLGYHVAELLLRGFAVMAVEPDAAVLRLALEGPLRGADLLIGAGDPDDLANSPEFQEFARGSEVQVFLHPPTARLRPEYVEHVQRIAARRALQGRRLSIAVVGPMYGGSLPIAGYLERAFRKLGHRTLLVDNASAYTLYDAITRSVQSRKASGQLTGLVVNVLSDWSYARVAEFGADICIAIAQAPVAQHFMARMAGEGIVTAFWFIENWRHLTYWRDVARLYDFFFHIQPGEIENRLEEAGCRHHAFVQTGCDPEIHRPVKLSAAEQAEYGCDISFAGAGYLNRNQLFSGLTDYRFKIWGVNWTARELQGLVCRPDERFSPEQFAKIVAASKINLNLHSSANHPGVDPQCDAINPRVFEIAACRGFQVCDPCHGLERYFDLRAEIPAYRDLGELRRLIDHYLAHPDERAEIAARARERALREHTYEKRAQEMLDHIFQRHGARIAQKAVRVERTVAEVAERVGHETPLGTYLATLPPDLPFTQETINGVMPGLAARVGLSYPEAVFAYLREMRNSAEALLAEPD